MNPKYPVYIISKGRWESRLTSKALEAKNIPYKIAIEPQEFDQYASVIDESKILVLPFQDLGQGSIPVRNWVWEHAKESGAKRHWLLDDNITDFYRLNNNIKYRVKSGTIFRAAEDFVDRYLNVVFAGFQYEMFVPRKTKIAPFIPNTRIYSCSLIQNDLPYRWRGKYNEDTDLSLRILKDGYCTVLFTAFLADKMQTMKLKGGNTDAVYVDGDNRMKFAKSLQAQHPDVVKVVWKFGRWHHLVDYKRFRKNKFIKRPGVKIENAVDNYGMELHDLSGDKK